MLPTSMRVEKIDVLLVNMPFGILMKPSIGLGLIKSHLDNINISSKILYFSLDFAKVIGPDLYQRICTGTPSTVDQVGEWLFSIVLFDDTPASVEAYISEVLRGGNQAHRGGNPIEIKNISEEFIQDVRAIREKIKSFMDDCVHTILAYAPKILGFSSVFQQHTASLALARRLKELDPSIKILFGGPNCEGIMGVETIKQFPFIDAAVSGEADAIIEELITKLLNNECVCSIQGVYTLDNISLLGINGSYPNGPSITAMDELPTPDYSDYFEQKAALGLDFQASLLFESSRGCWWGAKSHCTFCGLNSLTMGFRSKSGDRALAELIVLQAAYPGHRVEVVDNIMDQKYFKSFVPQLAAKKLNIDLFYEIKANLKKDQVHALKEAGIIAIQPGIESFSSAILSIMKKGIKGLQNIQLLKWCRELGVYPTWNFLWGFPNEDPVEYAHMAQIMPLLSHFTPPYAAQRIHLDRFSPLFDSADSHGFVDVTPFPSAYYIYRGLSRESVANLVYYFTYNYQDGRRVEEYVTSCAQAIADWKVAHTTSDLHLVVLDDQILIWDFRPRVSHHILTRLAGVERELYLACDGIQSIEALRAIVEQHTGPISTDQVRAVLRTFVNRGLMLADGSSYLALAVPILASLPKYAVLERMFHIMKSSGKIPALLEVCEEELVTVMP
jgi:ribosomal peptide maturation radical SAM protein 1